MAFKAFGRVIAPSINLFFPEEWMTVLLLCPQREKERRILLLLFALLWIRNSTAWKTRWLRETIKRHLFKKKGNNMAGGWLFCKKILFNHGMAFIFYWSNDFFCQRNKKAVRKNQILKRVILLVYKNFFI